MGKKAKVQMVVYARITDVDPNPTTITRGIENPVAITITVADLDPASLQAAVMLPGGGAPDGDITVVVTSFQANELSTKAHAGFTAQAGDRYIAVYTPGDGATVYYKSKTECVTVL